MHKKSFAILSVGNILQKDDGVAIYATSYLEQNFDFEPSINIINGGVEGINLLNVFIEYKQILILDAIEIDDEAGSIYHIPSTELTGYGLNTGGAHEVGVIQCIDMLELMNKPLPQSSIVGIVPQSIDVDVGLTPLLSERFEEYIDVILSILKKENINSKKKERSISLEQIISDFNHPNRGEKKL